MAVALLHVVMRHKLQVQALVRDLQKLETQVPAAQAAAATQAPPGPDASAASRSEKLERAPAGGRPVGMAQQQQQQQQRGNLNLKLLPSQLVVGSQYLPSPDGINSNLLLLFHGLGDRPAAFTGETADCCQWAIVGSCFMGRGQLCS